MNSKRIRASLNGVLFEALKPDESLILTIRIMMKEDQNHPHQKRGRTESGESSGFQVSDRRFWVLNESAEEQAEIPNPRLQNYIEELETRTEAAENKLRERIEELERENQAYRDRLERQLEKRLEQEKARVLGDFLEIVDNFERALNAVHQNITVEDLVEGLKLNLDILHRRLTGAGVERFETMRFTFDQNVAEAIGV